MTFPMVGQLVKCSKCQREIFVEQAINGINHTIAIFVVCRDCLSQKDKEKIKEKYGIVV